MADRYNVVATGRSDAAGAEAGTVVCEVAGVGLGTQRQLSVVARWEYELMRMEGWVQELRTYLECDDSPAARPMMRIRRARMMAKRTKQAIFRLRP